MNRSSKPTKKSDSGSDMPYRAVLHSLHHHSHDCLLPRGSCRVERRELLAVSENVSPEVEGEDSRDIRASCEEENDNVHVPATGSRVQRVGLCLQAEAPASASRPVLGFSPLTLAAGQPLPRDFGD